MKARNENFSWGNPLKTSLALLTIFNFGFPIDYLQQSISYLLKTQKDGGWNAFAFCLDPAKNGEKFFAGASSLTTVFCLKTLNKYQQLLNKKQLDDLNNKESVYKKIIIKNVLNIFRNKNRLIYLKTKKILNKIIEKDSDNQITLLAYYFLYSCKLNVKKISKNIIIKLGVANTLGWLAYAIYDDFLDGEGDPAALPIANLALRHLTFIFDTFPQKSREVRDLFHFLLNKIEIANAWEIKNSRTKDKLPAYKSLKQVVNKSIGLAITPLVILVLLGYKRESKEFKNIYSYFYNFIIAKQLNDDGHDWEEDFNKKYITPVVALLLKKAKIKKIKLSKKNLHNLFWREVIIDVCALIYKYVKKAKRDLNNSGVIIKFGKLESFLDKHKNGADKAIEEQKRVKEFLKSYR